MENKTDAYIDFINKHILPHLNYALLELSCASEDKTYAKAVLNELTAAAKTIYGETLEPEYGDDDFVVIPGLVRGQKTGQLCVALLTLDLSSSGEHWGTDFLTRYGVVPQIAEEGRKISKEAADHVRNFIPYDYGYTVNVPGDIHISKSRLPVDMQEFLVNCGNHHLPLPYKEQNIDLQGDADLEDEEI